MSQENVGIIRAFYASFRRVGERDEIHSHVRCYFDPICEYEPFEEIDTIRGHEALVEWIERWLSAWTSFRVEVEEIVDGGVIVFAAISTSGRGRTSGIEVRQRGFQVFDLREGKILRWREYLDREEALEAAGLSE